MGFCQTTELKTTEPESASIEEDSGSNDIRPFTQHVYRNLARIEDGETVIEVVKVGNRQASTKTCRGCKMKQGRTGTVPGQLASGQTLRFDPFFQDSVTEKPLLEVIFRERIL